MSGPVRLKPWANPSNGEVRWYVQGVAEIIGLTYERDRKGRPVQLAVDDQGVSMTEANRIWAIKAYVVLGYDGVVRCNIVGGCNSLTTEQITSRITDAMAAHDLIFLDV